MCLGGVASIVLIFSLHLDRKRNTFTGDLKNVCESMSENIFESWMPKLSSEDEIFLIF